MRAHVSAGSLQAQSAVMGSFHQVLATLFFGGIKRPKPLVTFKLLKVLRKACFV